jgi:hypothetical protein
MGREIVYCEGCGISLREVDFEKGKAREIDHRPYCIACRPLDPSPSKAAHPQVSGRKAPAADPPSARRHAPSPRRSHAAVVAGAAAGGIAIVVLLLVAALSSGRRAPPSPPPPSVARTEPARVPPPASPEAVARRPAPVLREPEALREPTEQEKSAKLDAFLAEIRGMIAKDKDFERRAEIEGMIAAAERSAGARVADVQALRALHAKAFDDAAKAACAAVRADAERLWGEKKFAEAAARAAEIPGRFESTARAAELRTYAADLSKRAADAEARQREEALARWKAWKVDTSPDEDSGVMPSYGGRAYVYQTHPHSREKAASLERTAAVPAGMKTVLSMWVAPDAQGDWELRVLADGKELHKQVIGPPGSGWRRVTVDLTTLAGRKAALRLEHVANDWYYEAGFWADLELKSE